MKVLIVEDEGHLAEDLQQILVKNGFTADVVSDGVSGLDNAMTGIYDVVILDIMPVSYTHIALFVLVSERHSNIIYIQ